METESKIKVEVSAVKHSTDPVSMAYTHNTMVDPLHQEFT